MAVENGLPNFASFSLPPLGDGGGFTSTPQRNESRRSFRRATTPPNSSSPTPRSADAGDPDENPRSKISPLDPRRFTPTLHANLVSEILNLRREVEGKNKLVLDLEESLVSSRDDNVRLGEALRAREKERSKMKSDMSELEGSTMSALDKLARERDEANQTLGEVKKRLEESQKQVKRKDKEIDDTSELWVKDQDSWAAERRKLDHKVHIVESRLKAVLLEVEAGRLNGEHAERPQSTTTERSNSRTSERATSRASGTRSSLSHRRGSSVDTDGAMKRARLSHISEIDSAEKGATLADELELDCEFEDDDFEDEEPVSPEALPEEQLYPRRSFSSQSHRQSIKARKLLGLDVGDEEPEDVGRDAGHDATDLHVDQFGDSVLDKRFELRYTDSATQYSPPASPYLLPQHSLSIIEEDERETASRDSDSKHLHGTREGGSDPQTWSTDRVSMISTSSQTVEQLPDPSDTFMRGKAASSVTSLPVVKMHDSETQTTNDSPSPSLAQAHAATRDEQRTVLQIPTIAIRPPTRSSEHRNSVVLPPQTRNAASQAYIKASVTSTSVQTEEIRVDLRSAKLPAHLLPSALSTGLPSPSFDTLQKHTERTSFADAEDEEDVDSRLKAPLPNRSSKRLSTKVRELSSKFTQVEDNDYSSIRDSMQSRISDGNVSDDSYLTRPIPSKKTLSKVQNSWKLVTPQNSDVDNVQSEANGDNGTATIISRPTKTFIKPQSGVVTSIENEKLSSKDKGKNIAPINTGKSNEIRKTVMISNGNAAEAQLQRARSPSAPAAPGTALILQQPPFPVPTRSSSRNIPWGSSDGTGSPTPQTVSFFGIDPKEKQKRPPTKKPVLRKIRSANHDFYKQTRTRSRSPPPSGSSFGDTPRLPQHPPPLPNDSINSPFGNEFKSGQHSKKPSVTSAADSAASEQSSVVDSIAQTMIGEWMWKYVRKRSAFGRSDAELDGRNGESSGVRHQRWVWLAPYERAVLWSSKQPTTGSALMGKSGRKLIIHSVLDVRDETPPPKGNTTCFGRSILILTPQRALKFTASSRERHYVWLKALSFLSSSGVVPSELGGAPSVPVLPASNLATSPITPSSAGPVIPYPDRAAPPPPIASLRRHPIRDSIRIAKGKSRPMLAAGGRRAYTDPHKLGYGASTPAIENGPEEDSESAAEAPTVPRVHSHTRRRSNTGPKQPGNSFRSLGSSKPSLPSLQGSSRGTYQSHTQSLQSREAESHGWITDYSGPYGSMRQKSMKSIASSGHHNGDWVNEPLPNSPASANFFDAMGGVSRMDAFVKGQNSAPKTHGVTKAKTNGYMNGHAHPHFDKDTIGLASGQTGGHPNGPASAPLKSAETNGDVASGINTDQGDGPERRSYRNRHGRKKDVGKYWGAPDPFEGF